MFFEKNAAYVSDTAKGNSGQKHKDANKMVLFFEQFKSWLDLYPFVRTVIRESLMPRVWTL